MIKKENAVKNVTLADIARETGFSVNTVSHALNNKSDISEKTKSYIVDVAKRMNYITNLSAKSLRSGRTNSIAIIVGDISNPHFSIMIKEMEKRLNGYSYNAIIINTDENEEQEKKAIISAISKNVDGIILCPTQKSHTNIDFLNQTEIPYVLFGRRFKDISTNYVICDDINGGFAAAEHLIRKNHKKILFINAPLYISSAIDRLEGIKNAFEKYQIDSDNLKVFEIDVTENADRIWDLLQENNDCTGIICFSDIIAMQVSYFLKRQNKNVPEDVSVVGFDNIASKFYFPLMITSVSSSKTNMSVKAVECIMDIIDNNDTALHQHILPTKIVERDSTGEA